VVDEACWLAASGVRELFLVSENSTSYGKDLGDLRLLETLLPELAAVDGIRRVRVSYLQPAEMRPGLIDAIASTPGVAAYFDLSFQHAAPHVLRRMRRFGDAERFLALLDQVRAAAPEAGVRSNFIVGFPGETEEEVDVLCGFLEAARLDAVGIFGYSDEDGTEAAGLPGHVGVDDIVARVDHVTRFAEELTAQRAEDRLGQQVEVLVESRHGTTGTGRTHSQGPDVDGCTTVRGLSREVQIGDLVAARVVASEGVDLVAEALAP
jgi:ribosomal protein S12 methylthiotransferase